MNTTESFPTFSSSEGRWAVLTRLRNNEHRITGGWKYSALWRSCCWNKLTKITKWVNKRLTFTRTFCTKLDKFKKHTWRRRKSPTQVHKTLCTTSQNTWENTVTNINTRIITISCLLDIFVVVEPRWYATEIAVIEQELQTNHHRARGLYRILLMWAVRGKPWHKSIFFLKLRKHVSTHLLSV